MTLNMRAPRQVDGDDREEAMLFTHVTLEFDGAVAILALDHPAVLNAVSIDMLGGLAEALDAVDDRAAEVRCLVITGQGRAFCAGANLQGRGKAEPGARSNAGAALETAYHPILHRLRNLHCPIVTSVNGVAAGAGMSIALMGDMIVCARSSYFLQAFRRIGLVPDCGSTWLLPRLVALALIRRLCWDSPHNSFEEQLDLEQRLQREAGAAEDFREGVTAFLEKRPAKFRGR